MAKGGMKGRACVAKGGMKGRACVAKGGMKGGVLSEGTEEVGQSEDKVVELYHLLEARLLGGKRPAELREGGSPRGTKGGEMGRACHGK